MEEKHVRRKRYKGTHPRKFEEKYKELQPEKYQDTIEKVIQKGSTPAGTHLSICVSEILEFFDIQLNQKGLDATLGYGGHTLECLKQLHQTGHIYAFDTDPIEIEKTRKRLADKGYTEEYFTAISSNFSNVERLKENAPYDFILADLGLSSMQIDNPERGFSFKHNGTLDLRLNPEIGIPASERLKEMNQEEMMGMFLENADEPYAKEISEYLYKQLKKGRTIEKTFDLRDVIEEALKPIAFDDRKKAVKKSCQRVFQAIRIDINAEFETLEIFLNVLPELLNNGGKVAILTFHSGEDRLVKKTLKRHYKNGDFSEIAKEVIRPSAEECRRNPRASATKMRWAIR